MFVELLDFFECLKPVDDGHVKVQEEEWNRHKSLFVAVVIDFAENLLCALHELESVGHE